MQTRYYTERKNARRAAKAQGIDPDTVYETEDGFTFATITDDTWPRREDGSRKTVGELSHGQQIAVVNGAVNRIKKEFAVQGVKLEFKGELPPATDPLDIPATLRLTPEQRREGWAKNPPKAAPHKSKEIEMPKATAKKAKTKGATGIEKAETMLKMLKGKGSSVEALCKATGWLPHTLRARLCVVWKPKKDGGMGLKVERERVDGVTTYRLAA